MKSLVADARLRDDLARFADELSAHRYLERILWPNGPFCPRCGVHGRVGRLDGASTRLGAFKCYACRRSFSMTFGTIFSSSHVPLHKWLQAIYLTDGGTKSMRAHHLQRILNVSFKTASAMLRKLERAARHDELALLSSISEEGTANRRGVDRTTNGAARPPH